jgi:hypothetical protein
MNNESSILSSIFLGATEERQLEFKEGFNWEEQTSAKLRDELIKAVLAMGNTPGGGTIILGIRTDTKKKKIYPEGFVLKDCDSFIKNQEQIKTVIHGYCQRPLDFDIKIELHPDDETKGFVIFQVKEFVKWPIVTIKPSTTKEDNGKNNVIENHAIYTRSKLAQWSSIKAGPQEIEDIVETAVKKYDIHIKSLGYTRATPKDKEIDVWFSNNRLQALKGLQTMQIKTYMEVQAKFIDPDAEFKKIELREAASKSTVPTFGWPIAVFLENTTQSELKPVVDTNGIKAELAISKHPFDDDKTFDYWAIHTSGAFFILKSIFEDLRDPTIISFNTRIIRITEVFMYLKNLYSNLAIGSNKQLQVIIRHGGIKGRSLGTLAQNRFMLGTYFAGQDEVSSTNIVTIDDFIKDPGGVVEKFTEPLFEAFDFYKIDRKILDQIVLDYLQGKVT